MLKENIATNFIKLLFIIVILQKVATKIMLSQIIPIIGLLDEMIALICLIYIIARLAIFLRTKDFRNFIYILLLFLSIGFVSTYINNRSIIPAILQVFLDFKLVLIVLCVHDLYYRFNLDMRKWMISVIKLILFLNIPLIIFQTVSPTTYDILFDPEGTAGVITLGGVVIERMVGLFWHPSELATFTCFSSFIFLILLKNRKWAIISIIQLMLSYQRQETFTFIIILGAIYVIRDYYDKNPFFWIKTIGVACLGIAFIFVFFYFFADSFSLYTDADSYEDIIDPRIIFSINSIYLADYYFPLGAGFGTFGGYAAYSYDSDVYYELGFMEYAFFREGTFMLDTYFPHIIGEVGYLGTICYLMTYYTLYKYLNNNLIKQSGTNNYAYLFSFSYLFIGIIVSPIINDPLLIILIALVPIIFTKNETFK